MGKTALATALHARHPDRVVLLPEASPPDADLAFLTLDPIVAALTTDGPARLFVATFLTTPADDRWQMCENVAQLANMLGAVPHLVVLQDGEVDAGAGTGDAGSEDAGSGEGEDHGEGEDGGEGEDYGGEGEDYGGTYSQLGFCDWHVLIRFVQHGAAQASLKWRLVYGAGHSGAFFQCLLPLLDSSL